MFNRISMPEQSQGLPYITVGSKKKKIFDIRKGVISYIDSVFLLGLELHFSFFRNIKISVKKSFFVILPRLCINVAVAVGISDR